VQLLETDAIRALSEAEAQRQLAQIDPNRLVEEKREGIFVEVLHDLAEPMILLLLAVGMLYAIWGGLADAITIFGVMLTLVAVEVATELRADRAWKRFTGYPDGLCRTRGEPQRGFDRSAGPG